MSLPLDLRELLRDANESPFERSVRVFVFHMLRRLAIGPPVCILDVEVNWSVLTMAFGLGVAVGPLLSGFLVTWGFVVPFAFAASLAAVGILIVLTRIEEVITPRRSLPLIGYVT